VSLDRGAEGCVLPSAPEDVVKEHERPGSAPIVCGVSDSDAGLAAAETAAGLSALLGAPLVLVHVARPVTQHPFRSQETFDLRQAARVDDARALVEAVCARCALGGLASTEVVVGDPAQRLATLSARRRAWMIVVGVGRRNGPRMRARLWRRLSALARCPVVVVPTPPAPAAGSRRRGAPDGADLRSARGWR
jgi:nucleotide-binding universal stress UspA family protein